MDANQQQALERLIAHAKRDNGQSKLIANFLLAWWTANSCGAWSVTDLWNIDDRIKQDIFAVLGFVARKAVYPDQLGYNSDFQEIIAQWRPRLSKNV